MDSSVSHLCELAWLSSEVMEHALSLSWCVYLSILPDIDLRASNLLLMSFSNSLAWLIFLVSVVDFVLSYYKDDDAETESELSTLLHITSSHR